MGGFNLGNSFGTQTFTVGHARKVWRRIEEQLPGGFHITNLADFADKGLVRSGVAVAYSTEQNADERDVVAIPFADIVSAQDVTYVAVDGATGNPKTKGYYEKSESEGVISYDVTTDTSVDESKTYYEQVAAVTTDGLNIIGFLQEDVPVIAQDGGGYNYATGNIIVKGEIYGYMLGDTAEEAAVVAGAVANMSQKNGLSIRVIKG